MIAVACTVVTVVLLALPRGLGLRLPARRPGPGRARRAPVLRFPRFRRRPARPTRPAGVRAPTAWITALDTIARTTGTGGSLGAAIDAAAAAPHSPEPLRALTTARRAGRTVTEAVGTVVAELTDPERRPRCGPDDRLALGVLQAVAGAGGSPTEPVDRAATVLRERHALREERRVAAAQAVLSARVLVIVPLGIAAWSVVTEPDLAQLLLRTPAGWACLAVGGALDLAGWWWMRRIVEAAA